MGKRVGHTEHRRLGEGNPSQNCKWTSQASGSGGMCPATRSGKACESGRGRKTQQERGEDPPPMWAVNKHGGWQEQQHHPVIRSRKTCKSGGGRKTPQERGEDPLPMWAVNKMQAWESRCSVTSPIVLGKGKACSRGLHTGELWVIKTCGARWVLSSPLRSA
jgi:hypothetical protein